MSEQNIAGQYREVAREEMLGRNAKMMADVIEQKQATGTIAGDPWAYRDKGMKCMTCIWYVPKQRIGTSNSDINPLAQAGRCRRHAPTMNGYPVVYMTDWCGDHRIDENKV
jgi:Pyruvate/2-oxoacid:ferredoxin oxidoreductase delta subunit